MSDLLDLPWLSVAISIGLWCALSFGAAVVLGRMIRRADRLAGIYDEARDPAEELPEISDAELAFGPFTPAGVLRARREPTRSGPFVIDRNVASSYRSRASGKKR